MIQVTAQTKIMLAIEPADFRRGIDGLACLCRSTLHDDPFSGKIFVFRNKRKTAIKLLYYDGQGYWLCQKRLSTGKFRYWPKSVNEPVSQLLAHELSVLLRGGDPSNTKAAPDWRKVG